MMRILTASTENIDDPAAAIDEIKAQLDLEHRLLKNSVGIVACHYEFVISGTATAISESLPFDIAGTNSSLQAVNNAKGTLLFTLLVFTSDDVSFKTALTPSLREGVLEKKIVDTYREAASAREEKPVLIFTFAPFMLENSGDDYVRILSEASGNVPCFGTLAVDDTPDFRECYMLFNGGHYKDKMSLILVYGNISPKFYLATLSEDKLLDRAALVTSSEGHILKEVNGRPVVEYFEDMGLTKASETSYAMASLPFMLDYGDGTPPVSKVFIGLNAQKHAICAGAMPEGSTMYLGVFDKDDVLLTSGKLIKKVLQETPSPMAIIGYSCISRSMTLGSDLFAEIDLVLGEITKNTPFFFAYSGGEMCPTRINPKAAINRFHNNTFILCVF
ncbi:FIST C-terminal domain-containing protein [Treponema sp. TIM-1]|uniref:FIST N-terminal domain-containing protein n=1 Tax=Treponema sp. TIM-1 TaxID=2898417 RepID=UPI00398137B2